MSTQRLVSGVALLGALTVVTARAEAQKVSKRPRTLPWGEKLRTLSTDGQFSTASVGRAFWADSCTSWATSPCGTQASRQAVSTWVFVLRTTTKRPGSRRGSTLRKSRVRPIACNSCLPRAHVSHRSRATVWAQSSALRRAQSLDLKLHPALRPRSRRRLGPSFPHTLSARR